MKYILTAIALLAIFLLLAFLVTVNVAEAPVEQRDGETTTPEQRGILDQLPVEIEIASRTATFDDHSLELSPREQFSPADPPRPFEAGDDPLGYILQIVEDALNREHVLEEPPGMYRTSSTLRAGEAGRLHAVVRVMNIPDDSVGGGEQRFDFIHGSDGWELDWYGERTFCRRMEREYWTPADELCP